VPKEIALSQEYLTTYGPERAAFIVRHALETSKVVDFPIQTFGGTKNFLPHALAAWGQAAQSAEATPEAETRADEQCRREQQARDRRQRLAEMRTTLPEGVRLDLTRRAEAALTAEGVERTHLGYDVLVKLDELLEGASLADPMRNSRYAPDTVVAASGTREEVRSRAEPSRRML
jgi:hypothetical protein